MKTRKSISAWAFENDHKIFIDFIAIFKGIKFIEKKWKTDYNKTEKDLLYKKFWN